MHRFSGRQLRSIIINKSPTMKQLERLTIEERELLFSAPVLLSVLACCTNNEVNKVQKADAIKMAHLKTFTADPLLIPFYMEVEKQFQERFELAVRQYKPFDDAGRQALKEKISQIHFILGKLDKSYANILDKSFEKYERHVKKADHTVLQDFIFPVPMRGLND